MEIQLLKEEYKNGQQIQRSLMLHKPGRTRERAFFSIPWWWAAEEDFAYIPESQWFKWCDQ